MLRYRNFKQEGRYGEFSMSGLRREGFLQRKKYPWRKLWRICSPIAKQWNSLEGDRARWEYLLAHKEEISLVLDNDGTYACFHPSVIPEGTDYDALPDLDNFSSWIGNDDGIYNLLDTLGIKAEGC